MYIKKIQITIEFMESKPRGRPMQGPKVITIFGMRIIVKDKAYEIPPEGLDEVQPLGEAYEFSNPLDLDNMPLYTVDENSDEALVLVDDQMIEDRIPFLQTEEIDLDFYRDMD